MRLYATGLNLTSNQKVGWVRVPPGAPPKSNTLLALQLIKSPETAAQETPRCDHSVTAGLFLPVGGVNL